MTEAMILPQDCDTRIRQLYAYWQSIRPAPDVLPGRQHLDPVHIPKLLPWLWLVDVEGTPPRFRFRLIGTEQVLLHGRDHTGHWVDESYPEFAASTLGQASVALVDARNVYYYHRGAPTLRTAVDIASSEWLVLPLARDGAHVDMLLALSIHQVPQRPGYS
jgi:hypothetical protein